MNRSTPPPVLAALTAGIALVLATAASAVGWQEFPAPFYWLDIAVVYFLAALPLAATLASALLPQANKAQANLIAIVAFDIAALVCIPNLYVHARIQHDISRSIGYVQQSRYGAASHLIHRTLKLSPHATWNGKSLSAVAETIDQVVARIEGSIASPLPSNAKDQQRIERAEALAMLGHNRQALDLLEASPSLASDARACNLQGTIYETQRHWRPARDWYRKSKQVWQETGESSDSTPGLARAITGVAFCERKLGHLREAEAAWQELLSLIPTADSHFLLAQFYEDTQQTDKAQFHAQQAMKLDPTHYVEPGRHLLGKLATSHFGCVGIINSPTAVSR